MKTVQERLDSVKSLVKSKCWKKADAEIDALYEDYTQGAVVMSDGQEMRMFYLIDEISSNLYELRKRG